MKYWVGVQRVSLTSWGEGASLALVGHPSTDGITIKILYGVDVFNINQLHTSSFPVRLVKTKSDFIVGSVETHLEKWMLAAAVISVDAYPFSTFWDPTCHLEDTGIGVFWLYCLTH